MHPETIAQALLLVIFGGSLVYCVLAVIAAYDYAAVRTHPPCEFAPISILKPLHGFEHDLEENLRSAFRQDYPDFEILFAVATHDDAAVGIVEKLRQEFPVVPTRLIVTGQPSFHNAKVFSLARLLEEARHDLVVMTDSDVRAEPGMLKRIAAEFQEPSAGLATCPYCCVPGKGFWPLVAALGMNTEFLEGILVARLIEGMRFGVGPAMAARREAIKAMGGLERLHNYLAEDFEMGRFVAEAGYRVILSSWVVEHRVGTRNFCEAARQRLRWARSTRRSRPRGYLGQILTSPIPPVLMLWALHPGWWPLVLAAALFRTGTAGIATEWALRDELTRKYWWLIPFHDVFGFLIWLAGFFGNTVQWRGRRYLLRADGTIELKKPEVRSKK
jgi:ceramide glucosyltransferase